MTTPQDARPGDSRPGAPPPHHTDPEEHTVTPTTRPPLDPAPLAPLARAIAQTIADTPVRLGTPEGAADLSAALTVTVARFMGRELGPDGRVLAEVAAERERQDTKWGEQNHPDIDPRDIDVVTRNYFEQKAQIHRAVNEERATPSRTVGRCSRCPEGDHTHTAWDVVLLEEVYEALAESDPALLRAELVQVAAVAVAWVAAVDRRAVRPAGAAGSAR